MVTVPIFSGYRTRLTGLLGSDFNKTALAEAIAASLYSRLVDGEKTEIPSTTTLFANLSLRDCILPAESDLYNLQQMTDVFSAYRKHLDLCHLAPKTKSRYWEVVNSYHKWLGKRRPDAATAHEYIAYLRSKGYRPRSVLLYYHALRLFFEFINMPYHAPRRPQVPTGGQRPFFGRV